ncbi:Arylsulfatase [Gimesia maris]|uniref:arylsulfatase n=1 Tax=Gimesia maris TaxID=122 RepID=UPI001189CEBB|nr:arylsulfatase [Gimesia maris]QDU15728.1 Arylsulfatase [Gimesia maris]
MNQFTISTVKWFAGFLLLVSYSFGCEGTLCAASRPNVIVILTDDQGYGDVGFRGNLKINTPHLDRMAEKSIELTRFYCSPVCAPTRASLLTGRNYYRTGVIHTSRGGAKMQGEEVTVAELLQQAGYQTGIFGKWHLGDNYPMRPQDQGFAESLIHKSGGIGQSPDQPNSYFHPKLWKNGVAFQSTGYCTDVFFDAALDFIDRQTKTENPFFVYLATNAPHTPLEIAESYWKPYQRQGLDETTARVYGMITNLDENIGKLLSHLERSALAEKTVVLFLGDNGPQQKRYTGGLRGRKSWTYEGGIRVPCLAQWPGHFREGEIIDQIAAHIDLMPTLLALTETRCPESLKLDGVDLSPLLTGRKEKLPARSLFFQVHRGLTPQRYQNFAVVTERFKLAGYPGTFGTENLLLQVEPVLEFYDLSTDPGEQKNVLHSHPETVKALLKQYEDWFSEMKATRNFEPGLIVIDREQENPSILCRYQDGSFQKGVSEGWMVKIVRSGLYRIKINRKTAKPGRLSVNWQGRTLHDFLSPGESAAEFELKAGTGLLDIWFQAEGEDRVYPGDNSSLGDVVLTRIK